MRNSIKVSPSLVLDPVHEAFSFQREAVEVIKDIEFSGVFHEQGLGKTKIAIDTILYWLKRNALDAVIVVTKKGLVPNWVREFDQHTHIKPKIIGNNRGDNFYSFNSSAPVFVMHYEVLVSELQRLKLFLKTRNVGVILDESQKIKNPDAKITKAAFSLSKLFCKRIIMTGTPIANRPFDIWSQIYFLDQGAALGSEFTDFKERLDISKVSETDAPSVIDFEVELSNLFPKIASFCVRETKASGIIELPEKIIRNVPCDWETRQWDFYQAIKKELSAVVMKNGQLIEDNAEVALKRLLRLVQIASNPNLVDEGYDRDPGKVSTLDNLVSSVIASSEKVIVWTSFTDNVDWLARRYKIHSAKRIHGKMNYEEREKSVTSFLDPNGAKVLIATPGSAKEGLTLTVSNHVVFYDRGFSLDDYLQAQDRIHRISQKRTCYVYNLILENSIDEWVDLLIGAKSQAAQFGLGDIEKEEFSYIIDYSFNEIIKNILDDTNLNGGQA